MLEIFLLLILVAFAYVRFYVIPRLESLNEEFKNRSD